MLLYFVVRGWMSATVVVLAVCAIVELVRNPVGQTRAALPRPVRHLALALVLPLAAVALVQVTHAEWVPRYFDAPARLALCAALLVAMYRRGTDILSWAGWVLPISVFLCAGLLLMPDAASHFWEGRVASYFMDPLTLAQHVAIIGFLCLFLVDLDGAEGPWLRALKLGGFGLALAIAFATQSRTGWLMIPVLGALWLIGFKRMNNVRGIATALLLVAAASGSLYFGSDLIRGRVDIAVHEARQYLAGSDRDTSVGIRLSLLRANAALFIEQPLAGWGFAALPSPASLPSVAPWWTGLAQTYFVQSGGHNEILQSMMHMGTVGLLSRLALYAVPLWLFARAARYGSGRQRTAGYLGLTVVIGYLTAGLTSEVFNLVYAASLYGLLVAAFAAVALSRTDS